MFRSFLFPPFAASAFVLAALASPAAADDSCFQWNGQYADNSVCVSSVLAPQSGITYGPAHLRGDGKGAWCEGAPGSGIGQTVTLHQSEPIVIGSLTIINGYTRTPQTFQNNGRVKAAVIETSSGHRKVITLRDTTAPQVIKFSPSQLKWARLTVTDVYSGKTSSDLCISTLQLNQEEFTTE